MIQITVITPISKGEATNIAVQFAEYYVGVITVKQTKEEKNYQRWLKLHPYKIKRFSNKKRLVQFSVESDFFQRKYYL